LHPVRISKDAPEETIRHLRSFLFYLLMFGGVAFALPFYVVYYQALGFSGTEIGLLTGISPLVSSFGSAFWTRLADSTRRHRAIMTLTMGLGTLALCVLPLLQAFIPILFLSILMSFFFSPTSSLADNAVMHMLGSRKENFGRLRLGGTVGFGLAAPIAGAVVHAAGLRTTFWCAGGMYLLALLASRTFDHDSSIAKPAAQGGVGRLLAEPRFLLFLAVAFAGGLSLSAVGNYLFPYMEELGAAEETMGVALSIGTVIEYPMLFFSNRLIRRIKPYGLFMLAMVFTGLRLILFGWNSSPDLVLAIQLLNGLAFPMMWVAGVALAHETAPSGLTATAQGLFSSMVMGIGMAAGGFLGGPLLESLGGRGLFTIYGIVTLLMVGVGAAIGRLLPEKRKPAAIVSRP
jgi:PPP family 3-phenylpropionic acid transporter